MKTKFLLLVTFFTVFINYAQNTYVPDDNFEQALIDLGYDSGALDNYVPTANINTITALVVSNKNISDLTGIEDFTALIDFVCYNNLLTDIDISNNTALEHFSCSYNQITTLDASNNPNLIYFKCYNNQLTELNVKNGNNTAISNSEFGAYNNPNLNCIEVDDTAWSTTNWSSIDTTASFSENCNSASQTYVPDDNFEQALIDLGYDSGALDNYVLTANINTITALAVSNKNISDLTGIEDFTALIDFVCYNNLLTDIDISNNTALEHFSCSGNQITTLDASNNPNLIYFACHHNQLTTIEISNNVALEHFSCSTNQITTLDASNNPNLNYFKCYNNQLTELNVKNGNNTAISNAEFGAYNNPNLNCIEVDDATWSTTNWSNIDATASFSENCNSAAQTYVPDDNFEQALIDLGYDSGALDNYVLTANINTLTSLAVNNKNISDLTGIEDFTALTYFTCYNNQLITIDISSNTALEHFSCSTNQITTLDASNNPNLTYFKCYNNQLTELNVKNGNNTAISNSDFRATNNPNLTCIEVDDATWSTTNWPNIDAIASFVNNQAECDALYTNETSLENNIQIYPNPTKNVLNITNNSNEVIIDISMYSILGKKVYTSLTIQNTIDTSNLKAGLYLLKIKSINKSVTKKIIISK